MTPTMDPKARWPWQRSLQSRILLTYGLVFVVVLALLMLVIGRVVYQAQLAGAEQALEIEAFLAANALQDPLSGYAAEFDAYTRWTREQLEHGRPGETQDAPSPAAMAAAPVQVAARLQQMATTYAANTRTQVAILDPQGNVVADSARPFTAAPNQFNRIEIQAAFAVRSSMTYARLRMAVWRWCTSPRRSSRATRSWAWCSWAVHCRT